MIKTAHKILRTKLNHVGFIYKLNLGITYKCNSRCKTCNIWKLPPSTEISLDDFEKLFRKNSVEWLSLTGGEPFLCGDITTIVSLATNYASTRFVNIPTNGLLTEAIISQTKEILKNKKLTRLGISISIDGLENAHNEIRGIPGAFEKATNTLKELKKLQRDHRNLDVLIGCTVSPYSVDTANQLIDFIDQTKIIPLSDVHLSFYHTSENYYGNNLNTGARSDDYQTKVAKLIDDLHSKTPRTLHPMKLLDKKYRELFKEFQKNKELPVPCKAAIASLFIDPYGDVFPCIGFNRKLGNIRDFDYDLKKVQEASSEAIQQIACGKCPRCWISCEAAQSMLSSLNPWKIFI